MVQPFRVGGRYPFGSVSLAVAIVGDIYIYLSWALLHSKSIAVNTPCSIAKMFSTCKGNTALRTLSSQTAKVAENQTPMGFVLLGKRTARCGSLSPKINPLWGLPAFGNPRSRVRFAAENQTPYGVCGDLETPTSVCGFRRPAPQPQRGCESRHELQDPLKGVLVTTTKNLCQPPYFVRGFPPPPKGGGVTEILCGGMVRVQSRGRHSKPRSTA